MKRLISSLTLGLCLLCALGNGFGQSHPLYRLEGIVRDSSGAPISGAVVRLSGTGIRASQTTGNDGKFRFDALPAAQGSLTIERASFATVQLKWDAHQQGSAPLEVVLPLQTLSHQVTVTATRTEEKVSDAAASVTVLDQQDLATSGGVTLDDALGQVPGFMVFRRNGSLTANPTSLGVSLRGVGTSGASRALVIEDGIPLTDPFGAWVYWDRVPQTSVSAVEVVEGGMSDLYGGNALGGVINIIPKRPMNSSLTFETSYGNKETPDAALTASLRRGSWIGLVSSEGFHTDGYVSVLPPLAGSVDKPVASEHLATEFTLGRFIGEHGRVFGGGSIFEEARQNGTPLQNNDTRLRQLDFGTDWQSAAAGIFTLRLYGGPEDYDQSFSSIAANRNSESLTDVQRVPSTQAGMLADWSRTLGDYQTLAAGFEGRQIRGASNETMYSSGQASKAVGAGGRQRVWALFGEDIIRIKTRWLFTVGGRADSWDNYDALSVTRPLATPGPLQVVNFNERTEQAFSPRLSALYRARQNLIFRASAYRAFRAPTLNELYRPFRQGNTLTLANNTLTAEQLTGAEAGASYNLWRDRLSARGTLFWSDITDPVANVTLSTTPSLTTQQRQNLGDTRSLGAELSLEAKLTNTIVVSGGTQYVDATVTSFSANPALVGNLVPHVPRHDLDFQVRYSRPRFLTASLQGSFTGAAFDNDQNTLPLRKYFLLDAFASRTLGHGMEIFVAAENLTGQRYDVARTPVLTSGPPILFRGGFRVTIP